MDPVALQCSTWAPGEHSDINLKHRGMSIRYFWAKKFGISRSRDADSVI